MSNVRKAILFLVFISITTGLLLTHASLLLSLASGAVGVFLYHMLAPDVNKDEQ